MTESEIYKAIVQKQDELLKIDDDIISINSSLAFVESFSTQANKLENERDFLYEKFREIKDEVFDLKQQLAECEKEKCRDCFHLKKVKNRACLDCEDYDLWEPIK